MVALGGEVTFITGPAQENLPQGCKIIAVQTAAEMLSAVEQALPCDVAIFAAAVADWRIDNFSQNKIKKDAQGKTPELNFVENVDISATVSQIKTNRPKLVIGFAAETTDILSHATAKLKSWVELKMISL